MPNDDLRARLLAHSDFSDADRAALVQLFDQQRRYGLVWEDKPEAVEETLRQFLPVLEEVPARLLAAPDQNAPQHTLIEGDNLHALTVLSYTHAAQIDVIYIDPPYNTGKQDFMYNDRFVDREDGYRHSKWLSFMAKRLKLAKTLLKESGVIFISIDDNEQAQLKLLCDEVFGEENFVANVIWRSADSSNNDSKQFSTDHNHTHVYSKSVGWQPNRLDRTEDNNAHYKNPDNDPNGPWFSGNVSSPNPRKNLQYLIQAPNGFQVEPPANGWRWSKERMDEMIERGEVVFSKDNTRVIKKTYLKDQKGLAPSSIWWDIEETGHNRNAKYELIKLFPDMKTSELFSTPKPVKLMNKILKLAAGPDATVLDFFAGSGTTLHATMALNAEDGGTRRCILVTNNENNICEQVTYERNRRVIQGYTTPKGVAVSGLANNSLRYYRCVAPVPRTPTLRHKRELVRRATDLLCLKENCYQPLPGTPDDGSFRAFGSDSATTVIVYDDLAVEAAAAFVATLPVPAHAPADQPWCAVYVFAPGSYAYQEEFAPVAARVRLSALPEALYRAWQHLLPQEGIMRSIEETPSEPQAAAPVAASAPAPRPTAPVAVAAAEATPKTDKRGNLTLF
ncbi:site-specific DNA-methyltransferase [Hymenobacter mucosus]|uniref:site-specific DNA-methyltransferase n=1 Tax=Hymenobacter mucosus TaxID=1411120 RepID=UPI001FEC6D12|nr:site-specific DNA-methyltransferase [Hymenobacter mucosus]